MIHPTAVIEGPGVDIDPTAEIGAFCYILGPVTIGPRTRISPHATIGTDAEHKTRASVGIIYIGADVIIREGVAVQRGTGDRNTMINDGCMVMHGSHIAHDCVLGRRVTVSPKVVLGGHTRIHDGATIGIGAMTHQGTTIGAFCMIGMGAVVTRDVPPFALVVGNPARFQRWNTHALASLGIEERDLRVEDGEHPTVREARVKFRADVRRKVMPLL